MTAILAALGGSYPTASVTVALGDQLVFKSFTGTAVASYSIANDGNAKNGDGTVLEPWLRGMGGLVADYEARATVTSGSLTSGTTGSWLSCSTTRTWSKTNSAQNNSTVTAVITVEIRRASDQVVLASASITLSAESDNFN